MTSSGPRWSGGGGAGWWMDDAAMAADDDEGGGGKLTGQPVVCRNAMSGAVWWLLAMRCAVEAGPCWWVVRRPPGWCLQHRLALEAGRRGCSGGH
ncbi:hypothetical protein RirG_031560 [Rhizophagus irregularis DAOM 197198w]|uniref:Uncharacterized protein n=1 Tax=Rhizophagus irregularis (strain DAOM 197198w) TaxID=1432141 RepID=A0A015KAK5_RHIIW|nr:hypothetical protein RirG_031560 [Rhizophagus irregularis DAOM 197198w]